MTKRNKVIYWISTIWLASGMLSTGTLQLFRVKAEGAVAPPGVYGITHLGYPVYFLTILGVSKILGVVALLIPKFPLLKEWAYAGFFFAMSGAVFSHIASGDSMTQNVPALLLLILTVISWYFRPADRKIISVNQHSHGQEFGPPKTATEKHGNHAAVGA
jgi:DoxX-like protein